MTKGTSEPGGSGSGGFHAVHAERDLESNWEVNLAKKLEEYLLKICSGEITGEEEGHSPVNFAEAALLLQGSMQVYSRKVEYLYTLVLRALEFLSQKRMNTAQSHTTSQPSSADVLMPWAMHVLQSSQDQTCLGNWEWKEAKLDPTTRRLWGACDSVKV
ncbi:hypothetical protein JHK85_024549 [Glycine max]|nr:hypothetical protein JHK85_024549 [Glycine max]